MLIPCYETQKSITKVADCIYIQIYTYFLFSKTQNFRMNLMSYL